MAKEDLKKFEELMKTDPVVQKKLEDGMKAFTGEQTEEAIFEGVLAPIAKEYGVTATYEEYAAYLKESFEEGELTEDELDQVAGGKISGGGVVIQRCEVIGFGAGAGGGSGAGAVCVGIGFGKGTTGCLTVGISGDIDS